MSGTFQVSAASATANDTTCVLQSMKLVSPPSGSLPPWEYDPVTGMPTGGRTFCLATTVNGKLRQFFNLDIWDCATMIRNVVVPITPQPPSATPLADLICTSCPPGCVMELVTA
jgi:hypothetical protein